MPAPDMGGVWGILGGTFDPVHYGHLNLAQGIERRAGLAGVLFVPSLKHPFKRSVWGAPYEDRLAMLNLALSGCPSHLTSDIERSGNLSGFALDTVRALVGQYPKAEFRFIIGADNLEEIHLWHRADDLVHQLTFLVGARPGFEHLTLPPSYEGRFAAIPVETVDVSSTEVRKLLACDAPPEKIDQLIPPSVREYIEKRGLYR